MPKRTKSKFEVNLTIDRLVNVPYVRGHFFTKVKVMKGDVTVLKTNRQEVEANKVVWNEPAKFEVKIYTDSTGVLVPCFIKVSVRREKHGGKSTEKLGAVTIDLTNFAGVNTPIEKRYLLQAGSRNTDKKQGKDNSILQVTLAVKQSEGDPIFRAHSRDGHAPPMDDDGEEAEVADPRESTRAAVELEKLEASLLSLHEASTENNFGTTALPDVDPNVWMATRERANDVVDSVLDRMGPPRIEHLDLMSLNPSQSSLESALRHNSIGSMDRDATFRRGSGGIVDRDATLRRGSGSMMDKDGTLRRGSGGMIDKDATLRPSSGGGGIDKDAAPRRSSGGVRSEP
eukprot:m.37892 g.37892  ORF g.37892 m.37892 type:complete len:343 (+) comp5598_c0_seq1:518-1546(+)